MQGTIAQWRLLVTDARSQGEVTSGILWIGDWSEQHEQSLCFGTAESAELFGIQSSYATVQTAYEIWMQDQRRLCGIRLNHSGWLG